MTDHLMYVGTPDGVLVLRRSPGNWEDVSIGLHGHIVRALANRPGRPGEVFAGSYGGGVFFSSDAGNLWQPRNNGLTFLHVRAILSDRYDPNRIFVGTEPAAIFRSVDGGSTWRELTSVRQLPGHEHWFLPYSPRAGAVRSIAAVPGLPDSFYAGIEQGGVIFTYDGGDTWQLLNNGVHPDVHQVLVDADGGVMVFAATGGGVYRSLDGGKTWEQLTSEYTRALAEHPGSPWTIYAGPARRVGHGGRIERSRDGGNSWEAWWCGLQVPLPGMVEQFIARPGSLDELGGLFAVLSSGEVHHCDLARPDWVPLFCGGSPRVNVVALANG